MSDSRGRLNELALFAGAGGGILGGKALGWRTICAVEIEPYCISVLLQRQNDGLLPVFPIWDDIRTFDGRPWRGQVDVVSGGFPCQDISAAGKGAGIEGDKSGLWVEMARVISEVRPRFAFVENSPMLTVRGLGAVLGDLASMGYDARWGVVSAAELGGSHLRERVWIVADSHKMGAKVYQKQISGRQLPLYRMDFMAPTQHAADPNLLRSDDELAAWVDRVGAIGNGQVPQCAAEAWRVLTEL